MLIPVSQHDIFQVSLSLTLCGQTTFKTHVGKHDIDLDEKMIHLKQTIAAGVHNVIYALFLCPGNESNEFALEIL